MIEDHERVLRLRRAAADGAIAHVEKATTAMRPDSEKVDTPTMPMDPNLSESEPTAIPTLGLENPENMDPDIPMELDHSEPRDTMIEAKEPHCHAEPV